MQQRLRLIPKTDQQPSEAMIKAHEWLLFDRPFCVRSLSRWHRARMHPTLGYLLIAAIVIAVVGGLLIARRRSRRSDYRP